MPLSDTVTKRTEIVPLRSKEPLDVSQFGARAACLSAMSSLGVQVPKGVVISTQTVENVSGNGVASIRDALIDALGSLGAGERLVVRGSPQEPRWGGPAVVIDIEGVDALLDVISTMVDAWNRPTALMLRSAQGAPEDAGLGLIVHEMVQGEVERFQSVDEVTGVSHKSTLPQDIRTCLDHASKVLIDAPAVEVIQTGGDMTLIGAFPAKREARAEVQIVVDLAGHGIITEEEALLRVNPRSLTEQIHPQIEPGGVVDVIAKGIGGSPGAAQGGIVFSAGAAQAAHAQGTPAILVRNETSPEDIRGMHSAAGVLTSSGGLSSHAAVIAQGIGVPCVVGASELKINAEQKILTLADGSELGEGDQVTINGADGAVMRGALKLTHRPLSDAFTTLMGWADRTRSIGVRANADTLQEAKTAKWFMVDGIGLCRTEHMFYDGDRINVMREMILAQDAEQRRATLERLLPMQRANFVELFEVMEGAPVTIRLLDPPLHEFLPKGAEEIANLAKSMGLEADKVKSRIEEMEEYNPMLGMRGVRLAVTMPEIYETQARAIFEASAIVSQSTGKSVLPEIMIPLVSAHKEVALVKARIEAVAAQVGKETGKAPEFHLGVMVETPRAALRAEDLAGVTSFLSFGTNDLTQMTYGLSRDDAGRFMSEYVNNGVFPEDPFLTLDVEGVGELLLTAARRGRRANRNIELGLCGEHGGDPASVQFCKIAGFDYVSCSPYRVPVARLAAAQASILAKDNSNS